METNKRLYYIFWLALIIVQSVWIVNSGGFYFIDEGSHFNFNRHYLESLTQSTGAWHRMGRVLLFALPAQFGLRGVQIASSVLFLITIYFSYKILRHYNVKYAEWIIPVIGFQPVLFNVSYTALAELPAGLLLVISFYYYIKDKPKHALIYSSLVFLFRTEYFFAAGLFFLIYAHRKNFKVLPWIVTGPLLWYLYTTIITLNPTQFFYDMTLHSRLLKIDAGIDWYYYLVHSFKIFGFIQMFFFIIALFIIIKKNQLADYWIPVVISFGGIAVHTLLALKELNLTCSIGQLRYVAVVGPLIGIVSIIGLGNTLESIKNKFLFIFISVCLFAVMYLLGPYSTPWHSRFKIDQISEEIAAESEGKYRDYVYISNMHQLANALDESSSGGEKFKTLTMSNINSFSKAVIVWCRDLEGSPFVEEDVTLDKIRTLPGLKLVKEYKDTVNNCYSAPVYQFRKNDGEFYREIIDYLVQDQTTWEIIDMKVFVKE